MPLIIMDIKVKIVDSFDLGYILQSEDGSEGQLRVNEMKGEELDYHLKAKESELFGKEIFVDIIFKSENSFLVSQFTHEERQRKQELKKMEQKAKESCRIGQTYEMKITKIMEWGYICKQIKGHLNGAVKEKSKFVVGDVFTGLVVEITESGCPIMVVKSKR